MIHVREREQMGLMWQTYGSPLSYCCRSFCVVGLLEKDSLVSSYKQCFPLGEAINWLWILMGVWGKSEFIVR